MLGDAAYDLRGYAFRADGFPGLFGVPDFLNRFLFLHSRLSEYPTLVAGRRDTTVDERRPAHDRLERLAAITGSAGSKLAVYTRPSLGRPFSESPHFVDPTMDAFVQEHHVPRYYLRHELLDQDYQELRLDPCCHFNVKGQEVLAPIFERMVLDALDGKAPPPFSDE